MSTTLQELQTIINYSAGFKSIKDIQNVNLSIHYTIKSLVFDNIKLALDFLRDNRNINIICNVSDDAFLSFLKCRSPEGKMLGQHLVDEYHELYQELLASWCHDPALVWFGTLDDKRFVASCLVTDAYKNISHGFTEFTSPAEWAIKSSWGLKGKDYFNPIYVALGDEISKLIVAQIVFDAIQAIPYNASNQPTGLS